MNEITLDEAKEARKVLLAFLEQNLEGCYVLDTDWRSYNYAMLYLTLNSDQMDNSF